ncbi:hypothetical protein CB0940_08886 [Cercospora beticola]|uniref:Uncharacterized protein n=1 Tax=Cercospora beticola TaxID=122368 RepID=A0A2G5HQ36_CERBT|nr:hypothetical protein CB0940_08886 [Cercospora beticola]PIA94654.1 hypothetical protein CB0940_08886 [Cercospora beticola]WPB05480.1 hypothetical protein RHO25_010132 [Cercospora beticola]
MSSQQQQQQSTQYQRQTLEQVSGDKSLPSYRDATKGQSPVDVTEKEMEIESVKKQSKLSALKSMFKEKPGSSAGPSDKQYNYVVSKNGGEDNFPFQHRNQMRFGC